VLISSFLIGLTGKHSDFLRRNHFFKRVYPSHLSDQTKRAKVKDENVVLLDLPREINPKILNPKILNLKILNPKILNPKRLPSPFPRSMIRVRRLQGFGQNGFHP
jgi:hypothetical protein